MKFRFSKAVEYMRAIWSLQDKLGQPPSDAIFHIKAAHSKLLELEAAAKTFSTPAPRPITKLEDDASSNLPRATPTPKATNAASVPVTVVHTPPAPAPTLSTVFGMERFRLGVKNDMEKDLQNQLRTQSPARYKPGGPNATAAPTTDPRPNRKTLEALAAVFPMITNVHDTNDNELFEVVERSAFQAGCRFRGMRLDSELEKIYHRADQSKVERGDRTIRGMRQERINQICSQ